jgi:hypothetical protein
MNKKPAFPRRAAAIAAALAAVLLIPAAVSAAPRPTARAATPPVAGQPACATAPKPGMTACQIARAAPSPALRALRARVRATVGNGTPTGYGPSQLQAAYQLPSARAGMLQTVAVVAPFDDPTAAADLTDYRANYGLNPCTATTGCFTEVNENGELIPPNPAPGANAAWALTASAQLDAVSAVCPNCHILLVEVNSASITDIGAGVTTAVNLGASVITIGVAQPETATDITYDSDYFAGSQGVAITAAAGDNGYQALGTPIGYPAASQYVTAVGGTTLTPSGTGTCTSTLAGLRGWCESAWNDLSSTGNPAGTESGCSLYEAQPSWQASTVGTGCSGMRTAADVAADADPGTGIAVYDSGDSGWQTTGIGGTAVAAAIIAGVYALAGTPAAGTYPAEYPYKHPGALNDVTTGNNLAPGQTACTPSYLCTAGTGYDGPTGIGTPHGTLSFTATGSQTGPLYNGIKDICADDTGDSSSNLNKVQIWNCLGDAAQNWTVEPNGTIQINGKCLDVDDGTANHTPVVIDTCNNTGSEQWQPEANGEIVNPQSGRCLDNFDTPGSGNGLTDGTQLDIWNCLGSANELWTLPYPDPVALDRIISSYPAASTLCADDYNASSANQNKIDDWTCNNNTGAQAWTIEANGTIQIEGKCMEVAGQALADQSPVDLYTCNGGTNQQWRVLSDGAIVGLESGSCLDEDSTTTLGHQLVIVGCHDPLNAAQTWTLTAYQDNY